MTKRMDEAHSAPLPAYCPPLPSSHLLTHQTAFLCATSGTLVPGKGDRMGRSIAIRRQGALERGGGC